MKKVKVKDEIELRKMIENNEDLTNLDVSSVGDMTHLFRNMPNFNQDISNWDRLECRKYVPYVLGRI